MTHRPAFIKSWYSFKSVTVTTPLLFPRKENTRWMGFAIGHEKVGVPTIKTLLLKSFMTVTVTVPLLIPMIDKWEIDPSFQVSIFHSCKFHSYIPRRDTCDSIWYMPFETLILFLGLAESLIIVNQWSNFGSHLRSWDLATVFGCCWRGFRIPGGVC